MFNKNYSFDQSLFSYLHLKESFFNSASEFNPAHYYYGGLLSVFTLNNFTDTLNQKIKTNQWHTLNLRDVYNIASISTIILPLAKLIEKAPDIFHYCNSRLSNVITLRVNGIALLLGVNVLAWGVYKAGALPFNITPLASIFDYTASYVTNLGGALYRSAKMSPTTQDIITLVKNGAGLGLLFYSREILSAVTPWAPMINAWNTAAILGFRMFDTIRGNNESVDRYRPGDSVFNYSLSIIFNLASFVSIGKASYALITLAVLGQCTSFLGAHTPYAYILRQVDRAVTLASVIYMAPQAINGLLSLSYIPQVSYTLSSMSGFISASGIPQFLSSITLWAAPIIAPTTPLLLAAGGGALVTAGAIYTPTLYHKYQSWMQNSVYKHYKSPLFNISNPKRKFNPLNIAGDLLHFISHWKDHQLKGGWMYLPALGGASIATIAVVTTSLAATALLMPAAPIIQGIAQILPVAIYHMMASGGMTAVMTNIATMCGVGAFVGSISGALQGNTFPVALKYGTYAGTLTAFASLFGIGSHIGWLSTTILANAAPIALPIVLGVVIASPLIHWAIGFSFEMKDKQHTIEAVTLLRELDNLSDTLNNFPWNQHPNLPTPQNQQQQLPKLPLAAGVTAIPQLQPLNPPAAAHGTIAQYNKMRDRIQKFASNLSRDYQLRSNNLDACLRMGKLLIQDLSQYTVALDIYKKSLNIPQDQQQVETIAQNLTQCKEQIQKLVTNVSQELQR